MTTVYDMFVLARAALDDIPAGPYRYGEVRDGDYVAECWLSSDDGTRLLWLDEPAPAEAATLDAVAHCFNYVLVARHESGDPR